MALITKYSAIPHTAITEDKKKGQATFLASTLKPNTLVKI